MDCKRWWLAWLAWWPLVGTAQVDQLQLNGLALFSELRHDYYMAALLLPAPASDPAAIVTAAGPQGMELLVTTERWSPYSFAGQWNRALVINNDPEELQAFDAEVTGFTSLPGEYDFARGDRILILKRDDGATAVSINDQPVLTVTRPGFFRLLLRSWIGMRPPSSEFRAALLAAGNLNAEMADHYRQLVAMSRTGDPGNWGYVEIATRADEPAGESGAGAAGGNSVLNSGGESLSAPDTPAPQPVAAAAPVAAVAAVDPAVQRRLLGYQNQVMRLVLGNLRNPDGPRQQGDVIIEARIGRGGELLGQSVVHASPHAAQNAAATAALAATELPPVPEDLPGDEVAVRIPFNFY